MKRKQFRHYSENNYFEFPSENCSIWKKNCIKIQTIDPINGLFYDVVLIKQPAFLIEFLF